MILVKNSTSGEWEQVAGNFIGNANAPIGAIFPFGGSSAPSGYLMCDGAAVSRTDYSALFAVIGTSFGAGDGSTTFNLPDLRETVPVGVGENGTQTIAAHDVYTLGEFKDDQFQGHNHSNSSIDYNASSQSVKNYAYGWVNTWATQTENLDRMVDSGSGTPRTGTTTHGKQLGVNYIIKAKDVNLSGGGQALADRVSALETVTDITDRITFDDFITTAANFSAWQCGKTVEISLAISASQQLDGLANLAYNCPIPACLGNSISLVLRTGAGAGMQAVSAYLNGSGVIRLSSVQVSIPADTTICGTITYLTSE